MQRIIANVASTRTILFLSSIILLGGCNGRHDQTNIEANLQAKKLKYAPTLSYAIDFGRFFPDRRHVYLRHIGR